MPVITDINQSIHDLSFHSSTRIVIKNTGQILILLLIFYENGVIVKLEITNPANRTDPKLIFCNVSRRLSDTCRFNANIWNIDVNVLLAHRRQTHGAGDDINLFILSRWGEDVRRWVRGLIRYFQYLTQSPKRALGAAVRLPLMSATAQGQNQHVDSGSVMVLLMKLALTESLKPFLKNNNFVSTIVCWEINKLHGFRSLGDRRVNLDNNNTKRLDGRKFRKSLYG